MPSMLRLLTRETWLSRPLGTAPGYPHHASSLTGHRHVAVVACMDARLDPAQVLGIELGSAHVIRNAGGRATDALRSVIISQQLLGTREIIIVHHVSGPVVSLY